MLHTYWCICSHVVPRTWQLRICIASLQCIYLFLSTSSTCHPGANIACCLALHGRDQQYI
ncbi:hypothetical protein BX661DRAFT_180174 [Kickxella alabastrina]|uniref:uncharacterized protein n=1 Tax=Kickxella alabastrina TaxID=61397 RepID=UPI0022206475|nr:uncharacterized protein BX661DRAFT_180174 [Kickxella alabastrina]KAI7830843.1 hypothetical protein BX661DRAFT_180174 [Kickxella alabastrina]